MGLCKHLLNICHFVKLILGFVGIMGERAHQVSPQDCKFLFIPTRHGTRISLTLSRDVEITIFKVALPAPRPEADELTAEKY